MNLTGTCCRGGGWSATQGVVLQTAEGGQGQGCVFFPMDKYTPLDNGQDRLLIDFYLVPDKFSWKEPLKVVCCRLKRGTGRRGGF